MDWREETTSENSLLEIYWKARKIASSRFNLYFSICLSLIFFAIVYIDHRLKLPFFSISVVVDMIEKIGVLGFSFTTSILGFLIAGFSIFASITRPEIFVGLAKLNHEVYNISRLKFIFFNFLFVFIHYLAFLIVSFFIHLFFPVILSFIFNDNTQQIIPPVFLWWVGAVPLTFIVGWFIFLLLLLKSFIWNIYQSVILIITTGDLIIELSETKK
jgi:hypothetical protein